MTPGPMRLADAERAWLVFYAALWALPVVSPRDLFPAMGRWGWAGLLPGLVLGLVGAACLWTLGTRASGRSVLEYGPELLGRAGAWVYILLLFALFSVGAVVNLGAIVNLAHVTLVPNLPSLIPTVILGAVTAYAAYFGPEAIVRVAQLLLFVVLPALVIMIALPWINTRPGQLLPLWTVPWGQWWHHGVGDSLTMASAVCLLLFAPPSGGRRGRRDLVWALLAGAWTAMVLVALAIAVFGPNLTAWINYPFIDAMSTVTWGWLPLHRLGHMVALVWEVIAYVSTSTYLWLAASAGGWLFARRRWRPLVPVLAVAAMVADALFVGPDVGARLVTIWLWGAAALGVGVPVCLAVVGALRGRGA